MKTWIAAYGRFLKFALYRSFLRRLVLLAVLALVLCILFADAGAGLGIPKLFWHERWMIQLFAGMAVGFLWGQVLLVGYLLNDMVPRNRAGWARELPPVRPGVPIDERVFYLGAATVTVLLLILTVGLAGKALQPLTRAAAGNPTARRDGENDQTRIQQWSEESVGQRAPAQAVTTHVSEDQVESTERLPLRTWPLFVGMAIAITTVGWLARHLPGIAGALATRVPLRRLGEKLGLLPEGEPMHVLQGGLLFIIVCISVFNFFLPRSPFPPPAVAICMLLSIVVGVYGWVTYKRFPVFIQLIVVITLLILGALSPFKMRIAALSNVGGFNFYGAPVNLNEAAAPRTGPARAFPIPSTQPGTPLIEPDQIDPGERRPMVIVCVSGGGIRAALWATAVLSEFEQRVPDFSYDIRMISGASGGMVGASCYVATLQPPGTALTGPSNWHHAPTPQALFDTVGQDSLSPLVKAMLFRDLPMLFVPAKVNYHDRGRVLEEAWDDSWTKYAGLGKAVTFGDMRGGEVEGWRPSLVFTPMFVEDGRRLIISNLNLRPICWSAGPLLHQSNGVPTTFPINSPQNFTSQSALQFADLFSTAALVPFKLTTASRLNASFPYVTPAGILPTSPRRRVVDAGYFDNYGVSVAGDWLQHCLDDPTMRAWLERRASRILVLQVRDGVNALSGPVGAPSAGRATSTPRRSIEELSTPPEGLLAARDSVSLFRNDAKLQWLGQRFEAEYGEKLPFRTIVIDFSKNASLTWYMTEAEKASIRQQANTRVKAATGPAFFAWWK